MSNQILEIENLTVNFDGFKALNNLNLSLDTGELRVIIGPNGAGKTTFLDVITGKVQPTEGQVRFRGRNLRRLSEHQISRLGIGRKFQTPRVYLNLTVGENLDLACNRSKNLFPTLFSRPSRTDQRTVGGLLTTIGLTAKADLAADLLSHGEKQRLEIGMLVAQSPELLLVDEPVAGLTDEETENIGALLLDLAKSHSIIVIEHDMEFVRQIARKVTVLHEGSVLCEGSMEEIQNDPRVIEVYLGQAPSITAEQMTILRIAASMAWADRDFEPVELEIILTRLSRQFATDEEHQESLRQELQNYVSKNILLEELVPQLTSDEDREMVLRLSYEILSSNLINEQEDIVYKQLLDLLDLPEEIVKKIEQEVDQGLQGQGQRSIDDQQMIILQIATSMAWADGNFEPEELAIILSRLSRQFAKDEEHQKTLAKELQNYLLKNIPLEYLVPQLKNNQEREQVLKLSYEIILANGINQQEAKVYSQLVTLLDFPPEVVTQIEQEVKTESKL